MDDVRSQKAQIAMCTSRSKDSHLIQVTLPLVVSWTEPTVNSRQRCLGTSAKTRKKRVLKHKNRAQEVLTTELNLSISRKKSEIGVAVGGIASCRCRCRERSGALDSVIREVGAEGYNSRKLTYQDAISYHPSETPTAAFLTHSALLLDLAVVYNCCGPSYSCLSTLVE